MARVGGHPGSGRVPEGTFVMRALFFICATVRFSFIGRLNDLHLLSRAVFFRTWTSNVSSTASAVNSRV
jgi:hypothetical protein